MTLTVPLRFGLGYPTANMAGANGHRAGKKSDAYKALAWDVEEAAKAAVAAGWETIVYPCRFSVTYYRPDRLVVDAPNLGSCESNCLTRAGVWSDDELARDTHFSYQPGSDGAPRVLIIVQRLAPPIGAVPRAPRGHGKIPTQNVPTQRATGRSLKDLKSGDVLSFDERDHLREAGILP